MERRSLFVLPFLLVWGFPARAGYWGFDSFSNDDALDWVEECLVSDGAGLISATLGAAAAAKFLEAPLGSAAIAASEVVAAARGRASKATPPELLNWLAKQPKKSIASLAPTAAKVVSRVLNDPKSELQALTKGSAQFPAWQKHMNHLIERLK